DDYFAVPEGRIQGITSVLTCVGGRVVHAAGEHGGMAPPPPPAAPDWSPSRHAPGWSPSRGAAAKAMAAALKRPAGRGSLFGCDCAY
ncbi:MAG TPA: hypothetical protein VLS89_10355, partial [Candidatus Nanopelagicales bacterium]|nr:hypothetical protein [Candidatus Nanopelagicales bacterium]